MDSQLEDNMNLLPMELFETVALHLDPDSLLQVSRSSSSIRDRLTSAEDSFWRDYARTWKLPFPPAIPSYVSDPGRNVGERMMYLFESRERVRLKKCEVWEVKFEGRHQPRLIEVDDEAVDDGGPRHLYCKTRVESNSLVRWNGIYVVITCNESRKPFKAWNTRTMTKVPADHLPSNEKPTMPLFSLGLWRNYLVFPPKTAAVNGEVTVLRIFNLEENAATAKSVVVPAEATRRFGHANVNVMETSNVGKAVVIHELQSTILIVQIPDGALERRISLPATDEILWPLNLPHRTESTASQLIRLWSHEMRWNLTVTGIDESKTAARLTPLQAQNDSYYNVDVTRDGDILHVSHHLSEQLSFTRLRQGMLERSVTEGDLQLQLEEIGSTVNDRVTWPLEEREGTTYSWTTNLDTNRDLEIAIIFICRWPDRDNRKIYVFNYLQEDSRLALLYKMDCELEFSRPITSLDRFATVSQDESSSEWILTLHCLLSGRVLGEKRFRHAKREGERTLLTCCSAMIGEDIFLDEPTGFLLTKYH